MAQPLLDATVGSSTSTTTTFDLPELPAEGDEVLLVSFVQKRPDDAITYPGDWAEYDNETSTSLGLGEKRWSIGYRYVALDDSPYSDTLTTSVAAGWGAAQIALRATTGTQPTNQGSAYFRWGYAGSAVDEPTLSVTLDEGDPTTGNVLLGWVTPSNGTPGTAWEIGFPEGYTLPDGWTELIRIPGGANISEGCIAYKVVDGTGDEGVSGANLTFGTLRHGVQALTVMVVELAIDAEAGTSRAGVFADWDGDGFANGDYDNLNGDTSNVIDWTITRGAGAEITGGSQPGSATITIKNPSDIYNPRNDSSPLDGLLTDGVPIWIGPNADGALEGDNPRGLFGGRITDITLIPSPGTDSPSTVEIVCEDALGWYQRLPVSLDYAEGRAHDALRQAALLAAGETRFTLDNEIHTMPLSHADSSLRDVLDSINAVNGTRHFAAPADLYTDWYRYTTRNRRYRLQGVADASMDADADHVTGTSGWRLSADTVTNRQRATVTPIIFTPATFEVWQADLLPFNVTPERPYTRIVAFDDVVRDATLNIASTGDTVTATLTPFASGAKIELTVGVGDEATITALSVDGRLARRAVAESHQADDTDSQTPTRGVREGSEIGNEYLGVLASARGISRHVVWRYGDPQLRPTLTVENWLPEQFELDLYDLISFTSTHLGMTGRLFEIVGLTHNGNVAAADVKHHVTTYVLQECKVQTPTTWFTLNSSLIGGDDLLAH